MRLLRGILLTEELTGVELGVDFADEPLLGGLGVGVLLGLHDYDSGDLLGLLALALGHPADGDLERCQFQVVVE